MMSSWILWIKALHIIAVIAWMAGLLYLPRLFIYHTASVKGSTESETFKVMERRLLKFIMNPAMIVVWITGPTVAYLYGDFLSPWLHAKLTLVLILSGIHGYFAKTVRSFANDANTLSAGAFRVLNEVPTLLMVLIVILVVVKPF